MEKTCQKCIHIALFQFSLDDSHAITISSQGFHIRREVVRQEIIVKLGKLFLFQRLRGNDYVSKRKLPVTIFMIKSRVDNGESFASN